MDEVGFMVQDILQSASVYSCVVVGTTHMRCIVSHVATMRNAFKEFTSSSFVL